MDPQVRRFVEETVSQNSGEGGETSSSDHEYAEIAEDAIAAEEEVEPSQPAECRVCNEFLSLVTFLPCGHKVGCPASILLLLYRAFV